MDDNWPGLLPAAPSSRRGMTAEAFGRWLGDVLRQQYADVLDEPIPPHLLEAIGGAPPPAD